MHQPDCVFLLIKSDFRHTLHRYAKARCGCALDNERRVGTPAALPSDNIRLAFRKRNPMGRNHCHPALKNDSSAILRRGKRFVMRADEKLTAFVELESAVRACGELPRQAGEIFPKLPGYENTHSNSSNHICSTLLCARPKHASSQSVAGRRLSRRQHGRRAKRPFESHQRHIQHCSWFVFAPEQHSRQV
jgi:hypothetical protein